MKLFLAILFTVMSVHNSSYCQIEKVDPPGTLQLQKDLYIDHAPVSNFMIVEFMIFKEVMKEQNFETVQQYLDYRNDFSDQLKIATHYLTAYNTDSKLKDEGYYTEMKYLNHPMLTMTKDMAEELCEWRTRMTRHLWLNDLESLYKVQMSGRLKYRLPTAAELDKATQVFSDNKSYKMYNSTRIWSLDLRPNPERYYMYAMYEYLSSDKKYGEHLKSNKEYDYSGFRCVCELE